SVTMTRSEIHHAQRYAVSAFEVGRIEINSTLIDDSAGPGLWAQCSAGCACASPPSVVMSGVRLTQTSLVGVSLVGTVASMNNVEVSDTRVGSSHMGGGGVSISACSTVTATDVRIFD